MDILEKYSAIHNYACNEASVQIYKPVEKASVQILGDIKEITIAENDPTSRDVITAHRLKDYRRKVFSLLILPEVEVLLDSMLKEVPDPATFTL